MSGRNWFALGLIVVGLGAATPAFAQEKRFELAGGPQYPLLSQELDIDQALGWHVRFGVRYTPRLTVSAIAEVVKTKSRLPNLPDGDINIGLYGLTGTWVFAGEEGFQIFGELGIGQGEFDFETVSGLTAEQNSDTDISLWYEAGVGCDFAFNKSFGLKLQVTARRYKPDEPTEVMSGTRFALVPSLDLVFRF
jgi:hypothetical protein